MSEMARSARLGRARQAFHGVFSHEDRMMSRPLEAAIEAATAVKITEEIIWAVKDVDMSLWTQECETIARAVLEAAGFEVTT